MLLREPTFRRRGERWLEEQHSINKARCIGRTPDFSLATAVALECRRVQGVPACERAVAGLNSSIVLLYLLEKTAVYHELERPMTGCVMRTSLPLRAYFVGGVKSSMESVLRREQHTVIGEQVAVWPARGVS